MPNENLPQPAKDLPNRDPEAVDQTVSYAAAEEDSAASHGNWRETFRLAFDRARAQQKQRRSRQELGQDKTRALIVLVAVVVALVLLFFGVFSRPDQPLHLPGENLHGQPSPGRKRIGRQTGEATNGIAPMLSADLDSNDLPAQGQVTAEDVDRTSGTSHLAKPSPYSQRVTELPDYARGAIDFSDRPGKSNLQPVASEVRTPEPPGLNKPSLVFVRAAETNVALKPVVPEPGGTRLTLPPGTRLLARLETPVSTTLRAPVAAVIEYNYEHDGEIVMPAGAKVIGRLAEASPSGDVAIEFSGVEMPDGTSENLEAFAMGLNFKPLQGHVSGKKTGTKFLVRSLTGLGTIASYVVGPQASNSAGLISTNTLLRERLSDNVASAGEQQLNELAFNQNLVVTIPANTRFYIVVKKLVSEPDAPPSFARASSPSHESIHAGLPTLEELRQLMQLRREINDLYIETPASVTTQPQQP